MSSKLWGKELFEAMRDFVDRATKPIIHAVMKDREHVKQLEKRVAALEDRKNVAALEKRLAALESRKTLRFCGKWNIHHQYNEGDMVTTNGSMWHCNHSTRMPPGDNGDWTLAVKRGTDARSTHGRWK